MTRTRDPWRCPLSATLHSSRPAPIPFLYKGAVPFRPGPLQLHARHVASSASVGTAPSSRLPRALLIRPRATLRIGIADSDKKRTYTAGSLPQAGSLFADTAAPPPPIQRSRCNRNGAETGRFGASSPSRSANSGVEYPTTLTNGQCYLALAVLLPYPSSRSNHQPHFDTREGAGSGSGSEEMCGRAHKRHTGREGEPGNIPINCRCSGTREAGRRRRPRRPAPALTRCLRPCSRRPRVRAPRGATCHISCCPVLLVSDGFARSIGCVFRRAHAGTKETVKNALSRWGRKVGEATRKAEDLSRNTWQHCG